MTESKQKRLHYNNRYISKTYRSYQLRINRNDYPTLNYLNDIGNINKRLNIIIHRALIGDIQVALEIEKSRMNDLMNSTEINECARLIEQYEDEIKIIEQYLDGTQTGGII